MRRTALLLLAALGTLPSCSCLLTDAQRAKREREAIEKELKDSRALFPYRFIKLALRSTGSPDRPQLVDEVLAAVAETQALPEKPVGAEETARAVKAWARLAIAVWRARESMMTRDEDEFPPLAELYTGKPLPPPYDPPLEHLALAGIWFLIDAADRGHHIPGGTPYVFYELSRAQPQPGWPADFRRIAFLLRGGAFCAAEKHYAAEEELSAAILELEAASPDSFQGWPPLTAEQVRRGLRSAAFFLRAWNRMGLSRDDGAADDLERGLRELEALGIDNELTQWGWAFVHAHRKRPAQAAEQLDKLARSEHLDEATRRELADAAQELRQQGKGIPVLLRARALAIIAQVLLSRAGGLDRALERLLGPERAEKLGAPLRWLARAREKLAEAPSQAIEQGKTLGATGLELVKEKVKGLQVDAGR